MPLSHLLEENKKYNGEIESLIDKKQFLAIKKDDVWIGYLTWDIYDGNRVFIRDLYILPEYRNKHLFYLRQFFRKLFPVKEKVYWINEKYKRYFTARQARQAR